LASKFDIRNPIFHGRRRCGRRSRTKIDRDGRFGTDAGYDLDVEGSPIGIALVVALLTVV